MAFTNIDEQKPTGTQRVKEIDDAERETRVWGENSLSKISGYPDNEDLRMKFGDTSSRPSSGTLDGLTRYNTETASIEQYQTNAWVQITNPLNLWTIATRPASPIANITMGFNTELVIMEYYSSTGWVRMGDAKGIIKMWSGSIATIPSGYVLCDGQLYTYSDNSTVRPPDLRSKFIVGAGSDSGTYTFADETATTGTGNYAPAATGGSDRHVLVEAELAKHKHNNLYFYGSNSDNGDPGNYMVSSAGGANGLRNNGGYTGDAGSDYAHENRPPFYALAFIYKI